MNRGNTGRILKRREASGAPGAAVILIATALGQGRQPCSPRGNHQHRATL
jgi:hypothetical protein